jgi:GDPmannose 4,6-dehydratase
MSKTALITGITGQDGSFLAELLLEKGYTVHGVIRRSSSFNTQRIDHIYRDPHLPDTRLLLHYGDLSESNSLRSLVGQIKPDEVYNLGAQSHVRVSFDLPEYTADVVGLGALRLLDAVREAEQQLGKQMRFYQASSSEIYGLVREVPQTETTPFYPRSPYACAKVFAFHQTVNYREGYGMHASNGILFNHESERRGETFVTRKITRAATRIGYGLQEKLYLGNLDASRDWGYARDYVEGMWRIVQQDTADDYVLATSETRSVREFVVTVFAALGARIAWRGEGTDAVGIVDSYSPTTIELAKGFTPGQEVVAVDPKYFRPTEVDLLLGDASKAKADLAWAPTTSFADLVRIMTEHDCVLAKKEHHLEKLK